MVKVTLLDYTGSGHPDPYYAADLLIFAKNTRVKMTPSLRTELAKRPEHEKMQDLAYIANTIPASWEFVDYTFLIEDVTRSLTHQLVRTRHASFAQQTMQILDMSGFRFHTGPSIDCNDELHDEYVTTIAMIDESYRKLVDAGAKIEDARELLPHGILTNIVMKANLRTFVDLFHTRISPRNLGMFRDLCVEMRHQIMRVHPWSDVFLERTADLAMAELDEMIKALPLDDDVAGTKFAMLKKVDQIRRKS